MTSLHLSVAEKNWQLSKGYFGSRGHALVAVAVVEWFEKETMYRPSAGTKKSGRCREVAVSVGSTVNLREYLYLGAFSSTCFLEKRAPVEEVREIRTAFRRYSYTLEYTSFLV